MAADAAIALRAVGKTYRAAPALRDLVRARWRGPGVRALDGVTLDVARGETVGIMGRNGAGKTTLLRLIAGLTTPTEGTLAVDGAGPEAGGARLRERVGLMLSDERSFSWHLSATENLAFFGALHGLARRAALARARALLDDVGLGPVADRAVSTLSTGMRQRLALARALLGSPSVLLLDEPTRGVDPEGRLGLRKLVAALAGARTIVVATHDLEEAEALCARVHVLDGGRVVRTVAGHTIRATVAPAAGGQLV